MKFLKEITFIIFLFILTALIYQCISYPKKLKGAIQREIAVNLGVQSKINKVKVNFFRGEVKIKNAYLKNPYEDFTNSYFAEIQGIYAKFSPLAFFRKEIILDEVVIFSPKIYLEQNAKRKNNFDIVHNNTMHCRNPKPTKYFTIRDLEIRDLEILQIQENTKAHNIAELVVKNIGAQDGGLSCSKLSYQFFEILSQRVLKQYLQNGKMHSFNASGHFVRSEINKSAFSSDSEDVVEQCNSDFDEASGQEILEELDELEGGAVELEELEPMACLAAEEGAASKEMSEIVTENEVEILELENAIGLEVEDDEMEFEPRQDNGLSSEDGVRKHNAAEINKSLLLQQRYRDFYEMDDYTTFEQ